MGAPSGSSTITAASARRKQLAALEQRIDEVAGVRKWVGR